ncbi:unnamed protein product [Symbiodinium sp. CCMP2592]|nr:unnamed protein product [Symbiodinium sp. CCMP2592]
MALVEAAPKKKAEKRFSTKYAAEVSEDMSPADRRKKLGKMYELKRKESRGRVKSRYGDHAEVAAAKTPEERRKILQKLYKRGKKSAAEKKKAKKKKADKKKIKHRGRPADQDGMALSSDSEDPAAEEAEEAEEEAEEEDPTEDVPAQPIAAASPEEAAVSPEEELRLARDELRRARVKITQLERQLRWHETVRDWVSQAVVWGYTNRRCVETLPEWVWLEGRDLAETYAEHVRVRHQVAAASQASEADEAPRTPIRHRFLGKHPQG